MDLFVIDNTGESELLSRNEQFNAITSTTIQPLDDKNSSSNSAPAKKSKSSSSCTTVVSAPLADDDEDDPIDANDDYTGDIPINSIDIAQFITLPAPIPKDPVQLRIEQYCLKLKCPNDDDFIVRQTFTDVAEEMKQCTTTAIDRKTLTDLSLKKKQKLKKLERSKTKGKDWFGMPATEITDELKHDMEIIQMRSVLDPKHFYKKNDLKVLPKYFQVGTVQSSPLDYYNERGERKNKKKTIVDELMADAQFQRYNKRKYTEIQLEEKRRSGYHKATKKMKKLKKNK